MTLDEIEALINKGKKAQNALLWLRDVEAIKDAKVGRALTIGVEFGSATGAGAAARGYLRDMHAFITEGILYRIHKAATDDLADVKRNLPGVEF